MELVQVVLPLYDNTGTRLERTVFNETLAELTDAFGGATAFTRNPAEGFWEDQGGRVQRDDVIIVEVMVEDLDRAWWTAFRARLEARFQQQTILIRAMDCRVL